MSSLWKDMLSPPQIYLGRVACVGQDVFKIWIGEQNVHLINMQKVRCDLFLEWYGGVLRPKANVIKRYLARQDVYPMIAQQEKLAWFKKRKLTKCILLDSYSELTDQKFTHRKEGWSFACHYTDLIHSEEFEREFESKGLLPLNRLAESYDRFFDWIESEYTGTQIVFIHYSTKYDPRPKFQERAREIMRILDEQTTKRPDIVNLFMEEKSIFPNEKDDFPYHYSQETYRQLVERWNSAEGRLAHAHPKS